MEAKTCASISGRPRVAIMMEISPGWKRGAAESAGGRVGGFMRRSSFQFAPESVRILAVMVVVGKAAAVICRTGENENHSAVAMASRVDEKLVIAGDAFGQIIEIQFAPAILIEKQTMPRVKIVNEEDR